MTNCCIRVAGNTYFLNFVHSSGEYSAILVATRHGGETLPVMLINFIHMIQVNLINPPEHINKYLTHWTGREKTDERAFEILCKIVDSKELKFSSNEISFPKAKTKIGTTMICFTDTPINQSLDHCSRYNYFGISFNKNELIDYGANPVLYLVDNRKQHQEFLSELRQFFIDDNEKLYLYNWLNSALQPYDTKDQGAKNAAEFYEREWRINRILPFKWIDPIEKLHGKHNEYPYKGKIRQIEFCNGSDEEFFLEFDSSIIENIIVPKHFQKEGEKLIQRNNLKCDLFVINR